MRSVLVVGHGALAVALVVAACGGGSSGSSASPTAPTSNVSTISILGERGSQSFSPNPASPGGQMVVWRNDNAGVTHRIVANDGSFDTGDIVPGATSRMVQPPRAASTITAKFTQRRCSALSAAQAEERPRHARSTANELSRTVGRGNRDTPGAGADGTGGPLACHVDARFRATRRVTPPRARDAGSSVQVCHAALNLTAPSERTAVRRQRRPEHRSASLSDAKSRR